MKSSREEDASSWVVQTASPGDLERFKAFLRRHLEWDDERQLTGGLSGAPVLSIDVRKLHTSEIRSRVRPSHRREDFGGHFILKVFATTRAEASMASHSRAEADPEIGPYVPKIVLEADDPELQLTVVLYEVATGGLLHSTTLEHLLIEHPSHASEILGQLVTALLRWSARSVESDNPLQLIRKGLAWRLGGPGVSPGETVQARIGQLVTPLDATHLRSAGIDIPLINPLPYVLGAHELRPQPLLIGPTHGDLHTANIIALRPTPNPPPFSRPFQIIDFGERQDLNALFDIAYLEFSVLLNSFRERKSESAFRDWWEIDQHLRQRGSRSLDPNLREVYESLRAITESVESEARRRSDAFEVSYLAASVEAALNFSRKLFPHPERQRFAILLAAARFTRLAELLGIETPRTETHVIVQPPPLVAPEKKPPDRPPAVRHDLAFFASSLRDSGAAMTFADEVGEDSTEPVRVPNFLLFERAGQVLLAISPGGGRTGHVDPLALQRTNETKVTANLLDAKGLAEFGFTVDYVHPIFVDPAGAIARVIWDGTLVAQAILFPDSTIQFPWLDGGRPRKILAPIGASLAVLTRMHSSSGDENFAKTIYASIAPHAWPDDLLLGLLAKRAVKTRFAPTPSNRLHLGNARTAVAAYLLYRRRAPSASFHLRIDDTDVEHSNPELITAIRGELSQLGIPVERLEQFRQSDQRRYNDIYRPFERILDRADLTTLIEDQIALKPLPRAAYTNIWFDLGCGVRIDHAPPRRRKRSISAPPDPATVDRSTEKQINLLRAHGNLPYYRFAGLVDDLLPFAASQPHLAGGRLRPPPITYVLRDSRQQHLTQIQAHIRHALEHARRKLQSDPTVRQTLAEAGLAPTHPLPMPVYLHLPLVTDQQDRRPLSKSRPREQYSLRYLLEEAQVLPEALLAYIIWTLLPASGGSSLQELATIARFVGAHGIDCTHAFFAKRIEPLDLVRSLVPIPCDLVHIKRADGVVVRHLAPWSLRRKLEPHFGSVDAAFVSRLYAHSNALASWAQLLNVVKRPQVSSGSLSQPTLDLLRDLVDRHLGMRAQPAALLGELRHAIASRRVAVRQARGAHDYSVLSASLGRFFGDLRLALTGASDSPRIESLLDILGPEEIARRLENLWSDT